MRPSSATIVLIAAALMLSSCGGGDRAVYTVPGHPPAAGGPPITTNSAQQAVEDQGADINYLRQSDNMKDLHPRPVDSAHYGTADAGFFDLYVFANEAAAKAAVPDAQGLGTVDHGDGRVVQVLNVIVAEPENGSRPMVTAVEPALRTLARTAAKNPTSSAGTTTLRDNEDGAGQLQGPRG